MIPKNGYRRVVQALYVAEDSCRLRATVHQVSDKPQSISCRVKGDLPYESFKGGKTALDIANGIRGHRAG
jgi:hypothetical protein